MQKIQQNLILHHNILQKQKNITNLANKNLDNEKSINNLHSFLEIKGLH